MELNGQSRDIYTLVTNRIIEQLQKGTIPWRKPWAEAGQPQNLVSKRLYRGINVWLLATLGYANNLFLTYNQLTQIGGKVKRGEKGHMVVYWNVLNKAKEETKESTTETKRVSILRYYFVFNIEQCENLESFLLESPEKFNTVIIPCEKVVNEMPNAPKIQFKEPGAYYHPVKDYVNMPKLKTFINSEAYYATLFHELVHSTGHKNRLDRKEVQSMTPFGSDIYSTEEIIAELGTCYLTSITGIAPITFENNAAYIQGWIERLQNNPSVIVYASKQEQKATEYILSVKQEESDEESLVEVTDVGENRITKPLKVHTSTRVLIQKK